MNQRTGLACLLALTVLGAGCGAAPGQPSSPASPAPPLSLATSVDTASGTWAVAVMGGPAASHNNFWQLFVRPAGSGKWRLVTPPGVASNGGLVLASLATGPVVAGFRPSQDLSYSPLATTGDDGTAWTPGLLDAGLADVPDALALAPAARRLLALLTNGKAEISGPHGTGWTTLASQHSLARHRSRDPVQAGQPHRGGVQPLRRSPAGRQLRPPRHRRHLCLRRRHLAPRRAHAASLLRAPGRYRPPAHHHSRCDHGAASGGQRPTGPPADSHLRR